MTADRFTVQKEVLQLAFSQAIFEIMMLQKKLRRHGIENYCFIGEDSVEIESILIDCALNELADGFFDKDKDNPDEDLDIDFLKTNKSDDEFRPNPADGREIYEVE